MKIVKVDEAEFHYPPKHYGVANRALVHRNMGAKTFQVNYGFFAPGGYGEEHSHDFEQVFFVLRGELTATSGTDKILVGPKTALHIPQGESHLIKNEGSDLVEVLVINGAAEYKFR
jgi:quercetin dioxygenase-like cupin family protein